MDERWARLMHYTEQKILEGTGLVGAEAPRPGGLPGRLLRRRTRSGHEMMENSEQQIS